MNTEETMMTVEKALTLADHLIATANAAKAAGQSHVAVSPLQAAFADLDAAEGRMNAVFDAADKREGE